MNRSENLNIAVVLGQRQSTLELALLGLAISISI